MFRGSWPFTLVVGERKTDIGEFGRPGYEGGMPRVFTRKEVDAMIVAAVAKATAPLQERIAALELELAKAKKNSSNSSKPPSSGHRQAQEAAARGRGEAACAARSRGTNRTCDPSFRPRPLTT